MKTIHTRSFGEIEYSDRRGPDRLESVLRTSGHTMPPETRARLERRLSEYRARTGEALPPPKEQKLDLTTDAGRAEHAERLVAETQADRLLEGI